MPFLAHAGKESEEGEGGGRDGDGGEEAFKNSELDGSFGETLIHTQPEPRRKRSADACLAVRNIEQSSAGGARIKPSRPSLPAPYSLSLHRQLELRLVSYAGRTLVLLSAP